jgi:Fur family transcriptional regulator, ferric uptake regulator
LAFGRSASVLNIFSRVLFGTTKDQRPTTIFFPAIIATKLQQGHSMPLPETEIPGRLQAELMSRGLRMTRQRRTILSVVETAKQHLDASQLLRRARRIDPQIDRVTVYRTLGLLKRHGLIDELDLMHMQGEKHFYERRPQRDHIHMACLRCGKITEFESDLFDRLKGQIQRDCRFHIVVTRLEVGGYCAQCRTTEQAKA